MKEMKRFGTAYGGFHYPRNLDLLNEESVIYCVGAGEDISHDIEVAFALNSSVYIFDPTPRAIEHVQYIKDILTGRQKPEHNPRFGGNDRKYLKLIIESKIDVDKIKFYDFGLYTEDCIIKFYSPSNKEHVSHSVVKGMKSDSYIEAEMKSLKTIMKELDHEKIDLLKIDIEGCECDVIEQMIDDNILPIYLSVDFDLGWTGERIRDRARCIRTINLLKKNGYKQLHTNKGADYSFMREKE